jgi:hypothetical protein
MADSVFGPDLGGTGKQEGSQLPGIGATTDDAVAETRPGPMAEGYPVTPSVAGRRYGAAAGQGYRGTSDLPGSS